jgi:ubiquitin-activating enzyme E1 C
VTLSHIGNMNVETQAPAPPGAIDETARWEYLDHIRKTPGPFTDPDSHSPEAMKIFDSYKILVMFVLPEACGSF